MDKATPPDRGAVLCSPLGDGTISNQWGFFVQSLEVEERIDGLLIKESKNAVLLLTLGLSSRIPASCSGCGSASPVTGEKTLRRVHISSYPLLHLKERLALKQLAKSGKEEREIPHFTGSRGRRSNCATSPVTGIGIGKSVIGWGCRSTLSSPLSCP